VKKVVLFVLALLGAAAVYKVVSDQRAKASLWAEITDRVPNN
jgi:hypothetical protein